MNSKLIGSILVSLRQEKGKSTVEAARDLGITTSALSNYENGIRIPRDNIKIRIADYYNRPIASIFYAQNAHDM